MSGSLAELRIFELAGTAFVPFVRMMLVDAGPDFMRIDRFEEETSYSRDRQRLDLLRWGRRTVSEAQA
jgi:hypothetical protein